MGYNSVGYLVDEEKPICYALSRESGIGSTNWSYGPGELDKIGSDGISMIGNTTNNTIAFNTTLSYRCKDTASDNPEIDYLPKTTENNSFVVLIYHRNACGKNIKGPFGFVGDIKWLLIPIVFIFGCYLLVAGTKSIKVLLALIGGCTGFLIGSSMITLFWKSGGALETSIQFALGLVFGFIFGSLCYAHKYFGRLVAGIISGAVLSLQVYYIGGYKVETKGQNVNSDNLVLSLDTDNFRRPTACNS